MSKMRVYDDSVEINVIRNGEQVEVMFSEVEDGDVLVDYPGRVVDGDAHFSGDESYDGWLFYDTDGNAYYPEDFGAALVYDPEEDEDDEEDD